MKIKIGPLLILVTLALGALLAAGCQNSAVVGPAGAIEDYFRALAAKDANSLSTLSCSDWEADALNELDSIAAVTVTLGDLECIEASRAGIEATVACTGIIAANYNGEILEIDLSERDYTAVNEGGEWRMCGYR